jgi:hypothetical protein
LRGEGKGWGKRGGDITLTFSFLSHQGRGYKEGTIIIGIRFVKKPFLKIFILASELEKQIIFRFNSFCKYHMGFYGLAMIRSVNFICFFEFIVSLPAAPRASLPLAT